jgi:tetratricopeptide (TPR) repeat protein
MDFLDYETSDLYFDDPMSAEDEALLHQAANLYPSPETEKILLDLHQRMADNLTIIVALYRFYYYRHRYQDALGIADKALDVAARQLDLRVEWPQLSEELLGHGVMVSMGLIRFYMLALKAAAYLYMRIGEIEKAHARLKKIVSLDPADQFGAGFLFKMAEKELSIKLAQQHDIESLFKR